MYPYTDDFHAEFIVERPCQAIMDGYYYGGNNAYVGSLVATATLGITDTPEDVIVEVAAVEEKQAMSVSKFVTFNCHCGKIGNADIMTTCTCGCTYTRLEDGSVRITFCGGQVVQSVRTVS